MTYVVPFDLTYHMSSDSGYLRRIGFWWLFLSHFRTYKRLEHSYLRHWRRWRDLTTPMSQPSVAFWCVGEADGVVGPYFSIIKQKKEKTNIKCRTFPWGQKLYNFHRGLLSGSTQLLFTLNGLSVIFCRKWFESMAWKKLFNKVDCKISLAKAHWTFHSSIGEGIRNFGLLSLSY